MKRTITKSILAGFLLILVSPLVGQNDDLPYESGSTGADGPLTIPRTFGDRHAIAYCYDEANDNIVLHGGARYNAGFQNKTLLFNGTEWINADPETVVSERYHADMVYDRTSANAVLFGGHRADGTRMNDTWIWDGNNWTEMNPANRPSPRWLHEMVYDSVSGRVLLFGGLTQSNGNLVDLWSWDGANWTQLVTTNTPRGGNYGSQDHDDMFFDPVNNRLVLYNESYRETYVLDLTTYTWATLPTAVKPDVGSNIKIAYNEAEGYALLAGGSSNTQTWKFVNDEWLQLSPANPVGYAYAYGIVYNPDSVEYPIYRFYGLNNTNTFQSTYGWDGDDWHYIVGRQYYFDMTAKPDGVWNFTTIHVPQAVDVYFTRNAANTPVTWLASEGVTIDGRIYVDGQHAWYNDLAGNNARGGPGGYDGGLGGVRIDVSGTPAATSGQGPGGGIAPVGQDANGTPGRYNGVYGNRLIQPLLGGSGGSGGTSGANRNAGSGGAGGGAILISSSRDVVVNGGIYARGGNAQAQAPDHNGRYGGGGSGGAIRIVADRILGSGALNANGGDSFGGSSFDGGGGRIRLEAYYRPISGNATPTPSATAPMDTDAFLNDRQLWIANVAGEPVGDNPTGSLANPDVIFAQAGEITVTVQSLNIPVGTPVSLRITTETGVIELPALNAPDVTIGQDGSAVFTATVPAGLGTLQATAEFSLQ
ncbi:MAG: hypothetical protein AB3N33_07535 [Puniceicoccaceae bacterium]